MQEDFFPAAEKILSDIENVLLKDPNLIGFEIIPAVDNENKSPVLHADNSLGLASWSVKPLYRYTYNRLLELRQNRNKREDPSTVSRWLLGALLLNPDVTTFWNMRRELVRNGRLEWKGELHFVAVVLYYKAKCFEAFAYRRWLLQFAFNSANTLQTLDVERLLKNEVDISLMSADRYANNYHAWNHREYIVNTFAIYSPCTFASFLESEWLTSGKWCSLHISDYSGFAYRQFLIKRLLQADDELTHITKQEMKFRETIANFVKLEDAAHILTAPCHQLLNYLHATPGHQPRHDTDCLSILTGLSYWAEECMFNEELLNLYPGHESFWYHRRFLSHLLVVMSKSYERYSYYKTELIDKNLDRLFGGEGDGSEARKFQRRAQSPLESAYRKRNSDVIARAREVGGHQNVMGERFARFLTSAGLEL
ncbi:protein prenyltransferase alpha subunit repeat-containing protein 1 [Diprion similis]|uniref:protein prenyltransferase alpha subunit repeat-containing protein 1 n=1 Tax=Diprion similis TaxID=362088 RepID=UPI001EF777DC|nr:protein prenyltransferase alpha subunit repeat-containing protein 1 [Diprion similis]